MMAVTIVVVIILAMIVLSMAIAVPLIASTVRILVVCALRCRLSETG